MQPSRVSWRNPSLPARYEAGVFFLYFFPEFLLSLWGTTPVAASVSLCSRSQSCQIWQTGLWSALWPAGFRPCRASFKLLWSRWTARADPHPIRGILKWKERPLRPRPAPLCPVLRILKITERRRRYKTRITLLLLTLYHLFPFMLFFYSFCIIFPSHSWSSLALVWLNLWSSSQLFLFLHTIKLKIQQQVSN